LKVRNMSLKRRSLGIPYDWDTPDMKGFMEYAKTYYRKIWSIASELARTVPSPEGQRDFRFLLFQVMATPLVYLYEQWTTMPMDLKKKFMPPEDVKKIEEMGKKAVKQLQGEE